MSISHAVNSYLTLSLFRPVLWDVCHDLWLEMHAFMHERHAPIETGSMHALYIHSSDPSELYNCFAIHDSTINIVLVIIIIIIIIIITDVIVIIAFELTTR